MLSSCRAVELSRVCQGCRGLTLEWLHLMGWLYLGSIYQGRCPLTSVAIKGVHIGSSMACTVIPPSRGDLFRKASALLSDGVPPTHWWYTKDGTMLLSRGILYKDAVQGCCIQGCCTRMSRSRRSPLYEKDHPWMEGSPLQGILMPMWNPLMTTLLKGDLPCILGE